MATQTASFSLALKSIFGFVITSATALEKVAKAADNLGDWAVESTGTFVDEARLDREDKIADIKARMAAKRAAQATQVAQGAAPLVIENAAAQSMATA
jgi:hypothetical protein